MSPTLTIPTDLTPPESTGAKLKSLSSLPSLAKLLKKAKENDLITEERFYH